MNLRRVQHEANPWQDWKILGKFWVGLWQGRDRPGAELLQCCGKAGAAELDSKANAAAIGAGAADEAIEN